MKLKETFLTISNENKFRSAMLEVRLNYHSFLSIDSITNRYHMKRHSKGMQPKNVEKSIIEMC